MIMRGRDRSGGFSLVELLVVMAIVAILMGISIPILQMFSQNEMDRGARALYTMVRSARVYASTYNVRTAVVYQLDSDPVGKPVMDSLRDQSVRVLRAATVLYQLPSNMGSYKGLYVPTPDYGGEFQPFGVGYGVLLDVPPNEYRLPPPALAFAYGEAEIQSATSNIGKLGMTWVLMYDAPIDSDPALRDAGYDADNRVWLMAHVFDSGGRLYFPTKREALDAPLPPPAPTTQRFSILFAPFPDRPPEERTWSTVTLDQSLVQMWLAGNSGAPEMGLIGIPIEIYRSTGRVRMGSL